jgi:hypothetical protein
MGDPYKGKVAGHALESGGRSHAEYPYRKDIPRPAVCECGATSELLPTNEARKQWHREHKADMIDTFVARGVDDRGREVHL